MGLRVYNGVRPERGVTPTLSFQIRPNGDTGPGGGGASWGTASGAGAACLAEPGAGRGSEIQRIRGSEFRGNGGHHHTEPEALVPVVRIVPVAGGATDDPPLRSNDPPRNTRRTSSLASRFSRPSSGL